MFVDKVVESTNALEIKDGIYGKGALTLMLTKLITDELITWESYIYRVQEVGANDIKICLLQAIILLIQTELMLLK